MKGALGKPLVRKTRREIRREKEERKQAKRDRFNVEKMTAEAKQHFERFGRYGFQRTRDCPSCAGTGDAKGNEAEMCEQCMCGSCCQEKFYCGGCACYSCDESSSSDSSSEDSSSDSAESDVDESTFRV